MIQDLAHKAAMQLKRDIRTKLPELRVSVNVNKNRYSTVDIMLAGDIDNNNIRRIYELSKHYTRVFLLQYCSNTVLRRIPVVNSIRLKYLGE